MFRAVNIVRCFSHGSSACCDVQVPVLFLNRAHRQHTFLFKPHIQCEWICGGRHRGFQFVVDYKYPRAFGAFPRSQGQLPQSPPLVPLVPMFILSVLPVVASFAAWFTPASATNQATCSNSTLSDFKITALYTDPALNAGLPAEGFPITSTFASVDHLTFYSVLTVRDFLCPGCPLF